MSNKFWVDRYPGFNSQSMLRADIFLNIQEIVNAIAALLLRIIVARAQAAHGTAAKLISHSWFFQRRLGLEYDSMLLDGAASSYHLIITTALCATVLLVPMLLSCLSKTPIYLSIQNRDNDFIKHLFNKHWVSASTAWVKEAWSTSYDSEYDYDDNLEKSTDFWCCTLPSWPIYVQATDGSNQALGHIKKVHCIASQCTHEVVAQLLKLFMMTHSVKAL